MAKRRPASALLVVGMLAGILVAAIGAGYTVAKPSLGDGSAHLAKGHTVAHVNGESGRSDAELARSLATGTERLQVVRLPDGRVAIVNRDTGQVTFIDPGTMTETGPPQPPRGGDVTAIPTQSDGYLVDRERGTVEVINPAGGAAGPPPVQVPDGILAAVPAGDAIWVLTKSGEIIAIVRGARTRSVRLPAVPQGITVADGHPVVVTTDGTAYTVDGAQPRSLGQLAVAGATVVLGAWEGADRYVIAVDTRTGRVAGLDPRSGRTVTVDLAIAAGRAQLAAPVLLGAFAYVPDYAGPALWRVDLVRGRADPRPLEVHGNPGPFELKVAGGRVWANSQYDRRVLVVERDGTHRYADKGPGAGVTDSSQPGGNGSPGPSQSPSPGPSGSSSAPPPPPGPPGPGGGEDPSATRVTVPAFPRGTPYQRACERLQELDLRCDPVAGGDRGGRATGEVFETVPGAGSQVPVQSRVLVRYVGPVRVPDVTGDPQADACAQVRAANLVCAASKDPAPAPSPAQLGVVIRQQPPAGREVAKGSRVTVTYHDTITLPALTGQADSAACAQVSGLQMRCVLVPGTTAGPGRPQGQVYEQSPAAGQLAAIGSTVRITVYAGEGALPSWIGLGQADACARVTQAGFVCQPVEGATAVGSGEAPGTVYVQEPQAGTVAPVGSAVRLTYRSGSNALPSYGGAEINAACADIAARGFVCQPVQQLHPTTNTVFGQNPGPGNHPIGTGVQVAYSPYATVEFSIYRHRSLNVWVLRQTGQIPGDYGEPSFRVGRAYAPNTRFGGQRVINGFYCAISAAACSGLNPNHFYSAVDSYANPNWNGPNEIAVFMPCNVPGARGIYRTWTDRGSTRFYGITDNPGGGVTGQELLGCVW